VLESAAEAPTSRSGFAPDALRAAVHFVDASSSFDEALERSLEFAGPANYSPVLVGSIAGARWGSTSVDSAFVAHHGELLSRVERATFDVAFVHPDVNPVPAWPLS
jgi:ADP-ribosylglycohydrolase